MGVNCLYGVDAGTDWGATQGAANDGRCAPAGGPNGCIPGCGIQSGGIPWCNARHPWINGNCLCGFGYCKGRPQPWHPENLPALLKIQQDKSPNRFQFGSFNGYNEVIIDAIEKDTHLPHSIEAFFYVPGCKGQVMLGRECTGLDGARRVHEAFKKEHPEANVPLLAFRPF